MKPDQLILRGYSKKEPDNSWYSICIDLNILAQGDTAYEAEEKLKIMIKDYVYEAFTKDEKYFLDLIPRPAPFYFIANYYFLSLKSLITKTLTSHLIKNYVPLIPSNALNFPSFDNSYHFQNEHNKTECHK